MRKSCVLLGLCVFILMFSSLIAGTATAGQGKAWVNTLTAGTWTGTVNYMDPGGTKTTVEGVTFTFAAQDGYFFNGTAAYTVDSVDVTIPFSGAFDWMNKHSLQMTAVDATSQATLVITGRLIGKKVMVILGSDLVSGKTFQGVLQWTKPAE